MFSFFRYDFYICCFQIQLLTSDDTHLYLNAKFEVETSPLETQLGGRRLDDKYVRLCTSLNHEHYYGFRFMLF